MSVVKDLTNIYAQGRQGKVDQAVGNYNAGIAEQEGAIAGDQATQQENITRNSSRIALGRQLAAFGAAGTGYGGSSGGSLKQSAVSQELDALNVRYRGALTRWGYTEQAKMDRFGGAVKKGNAQASAVGSGVDVLATVASYGANGYSAGGG